MNGFQLRITAERADGAFLFTDCSCVHPLNLIVEAVEKVGSRLSPEGGKKMFLLDSDDGICQIGAHKSKIHLISKDDLG